MSSTFVAFFVIASEIDDDESRHERGPEEAP